MNLYFLKNIRFSKLYLYFFLFFFLIFFFSSFSTAMAVYGTIIYQVLELRCLVLTEIQVILWPGAIQSSFNANGETVIKKIELILITLTGKSFRYTKINFKILLFIQYIIKGTLFYQNSLRYTFYPSSLSISLTLLWPNMIFGFGSSSHRITPGLIYQ